MKKTLMMAGVLMMLGACTPMLPKQEVQVEKVLTIGDISKNDYLLTTVLPNKGITLGFDNEGRVFGYSGLNRYFGRVRLNGDLIVIDPLATTRMGGTKDQFITENVYLSLLKSMTQIELKKEKLILSNSKGDVLEFLPINSNDNN